MKVQVPVQVDLYSMKYTWYEIQGIAGWSRCADIRHACADISDYQVGL
jgi:hypothetical protein